MQQIMKAKMIQVVVYQIILLIGNLGFRYSTNSVFSALCQKLSQIIQRLLLKKLEL